MYAVIKSGGKQHRVIEGETLRLEKLDVATGDSIDFEDVLMVGEGAKVKIGTPNVKGGKVTAEVMAHGPVQKAQHSTAQDGVACHGMAWHGMAWHGMTWHGMA